MVVSCLTVYAIAFSCITLLTGRTHAATPIQTDMMTRQSFRKGTKIHLHNHVKANAPVEIADSAKSSERLEKTVVETDVSKVLQSSYIPSNSVKVEKLSNESIRSLNKSHSYFALFDPLSNATRRFGWMKSLGSGIHHRNFKGISESESENETVNNKVAKKNFTNGKICNFLALDTLQDSEKELMVHYNGITAKETIVKTGVDEETGETQGLKLRQLTDGTNFIQLIYKFDNTLQDCEYIRQKNAIQKFLNSFKDNVEKAKIHYETSEKGKGLARQVHLDEEIQDTHSSDEDDYLEEDEGKIEKYFLDETSEDYEEEDGNFGTKYRNVTFQIIRQKEDLPRELREWLNYPMLKRDCKRNHRILKQLALDKKHGDESAKKLAEEHIERVKRSLEFSLIFPGTKWCGKSHIAEKYTALGGFSKTDKCCRIHDHCHPLISAFENKYDFYNFRPFTISHCRCDLRRKRDIMDVLLVPGTKWCGKGRRATKYTSLGGFSRTDKCCRVHDTMCPHWIGSLEEKYGLFNWRINTIMHCRCDKRFRACLKMAKTGTANFVGKLFFNVVQTKCFVLKPQEVCLKYSWWGETCEKKGYKKKAYLKDNLSY